MSIELVFILTIVVLLTGVTGVAVIPEKYRATWVIFMVLINALLTAIPSIEAITGNIFRKLVKFYRLNKWI